MMKSEKVMIILTYPNLGCTMTTDGATNAVWHNSYKFGAQEKIWNTHRTHAVRKIGVTPKLLKNFENGTGQAGHAGGSMW